MIRINDKPTTTDFRVGSNDVISHRIHRHELPVVSGRMRIVHQCADWVVVDKPASVPVHPCGRYRHNTVLFILAKEDGLPGLHTVHRLDRLTSGVLLFARTAAKAREMEAAISGREVEKEYVARVVGEFPEGEIVCKEPILVVSYKIGVCVVDAAGKECQTVFQRVAYRCLAPVDLVLTPVWRDGVSVVRCRPRTGRMHQIRVHLQFLGHPIANDPLYNSTGWVSLAW
jgi:RluA family pseudouridine synthase